MTLAEILASITSEYRGVVPLNHGTHTYNDRECTPQPAVLVPYSDGREGGYWAAQPDK